MEWLPLSGVLLAHRKALNSEQAAVGAGNGALDQQQILLGIHAHDAQAAHGHLLVAHLAGLAGALEGAGRIGRAARLRLAVDHGAVGHVGAVEVEPLDDSLETFPLEMPVTLTRWPGWKMSHFMASPSLYSPVSSVRI